MLFLLFLGWIARSTERADARQRERDWNKHQKRLDQAVEKREQEEVKYIEALRNGIDLHAAENEAWWRREPDIVIGVLENTWTRYGIDPDTIATFRELKQKDKERRREELKQFPGLYAAIQAAEAKHE